MWHDNAVAARQSGEVVDVGKSADALPRYAEHPNTPFFPARPVGLASASSLPAIRQREEREGISHDVFREKLHMC